MLILALGIGGTTAIHSVVDRVLLRPLPFQDPDRLAVLWGTEPGYFAHARMPFNDMQLLVAPAAGSRGLTSQIREAVWALDPQLPVENIETLHQIRASAVAPDRFRTLLLGGFAALSALLAAVGAMGSCRTR